MPFGNANEISLENITLFHLCYLIGTNFRVALISRFSRFQKNRELKVTRKKIPANFNVAKFNTLLYFLFSQLNEETHVYVL